MGFGVCGYSASNGPGKQVMAELAFASSTSIIKLKRAAFSQIHRIGQIRPVRVVRFIMQDSIEERMIKLQDAKAALGKGSV